MTLRLYSPGEPHAALVLAHGAGAGQGSSFMVGAAEGFAARGILAATFDFPYIAAGRKVPDAAPVLEARWRDMLEEARAACAGLPLFIGGKSMGGRMASHVVAQGAPGVYGLVFLGYPLHPPGRPDRRRDAHLATISTPMLFVQGSRDAFGTAEEIRALLPHLAEATLHEVPGADHSFVVAGRGKASADRVLSGILDAVTTWIGARSRLV